MATMRIAVNVGRPPVMGNITNRNLAAPMTRWGRIYTVVSTVGKCKLKTPLILNHLFSQ